MNFYIDYIVYMNFYYESEQKKINLEEIYCSLGAYCITSFLLKSFKLKIESHPFDWQITTIENVIHMIEDNFTELMNKNNIIEMQNSSSKNIYYFDSVKKLVPDTLMDICHHNLKQKKDYQYFERCIDRFNKLNKYKSIKFVFINPLYRNNIECDFSKYKKLYNILFNILVNKFNDTHVKLYIFNIVNKNNETYNEKIINENFKIYELDTKIVSGPGGMEYFDKNGIEKFKKIIME
jgi:hypothetical protein